MPGTCRPLSSSTTDLSAHNILCLSPCRVVGYSLPMRLEKLEKGLRPTTSYRTLRLYGPSILGVKQVFYRIHAPPELSHSIILVRPENTTCCVSSAPVFHRKKFLSTATHRLRHHPYPWGMLAPKHPPLGPVFLLPFRQKKNGPEPHQPRAHLKNPNNYPPARHRSSCGCHAFACPCCRWTPSGRKHAFSGGGLPRPPPPSVLCAVAFPGHRAIYQTKPTPSPAGTHPTPRRSPPAGVCRDRRDSPRGRRCGRRPR